MPDMQHNRGSEISQTLWCRIDVKQKTAIPLHRFLGDSLAQQVEHIPFKDGVVGSSPTRITMTGNRPSFFYP